MRLPAFRALWLGQLLALTAQNGIHFVQLVLIERLTGRSVHMGVMVAAFTLPPVLLSIFAGVVVDRVPKKWIIVVSNLLRGGLALSYVLLLRGLNGTGQGQTALLLLAIYTITFAGASVGAFFNPAVLAKIPLLVGEKRLMVANSVFNITIAGAQIFGLIALAPAAVKLFGVPPAFGLMGGLYLVAFFLVLRLPRDPGRQVRGITAAGGRERVLREFREGWAFVVRKRVIYMGILHLTLVATLIMILAMLAPGLASRVLGLAPEDAVFIFAPAGVGMVVAIFFLGRWGTHIPHEWLQTIMVFLAAFGFGMLSWLSRDYNSARIPIFDVYPQRLVPLSTAVAITAAFLGFSLYSINTIAQTVIQRYSPANLRGRVFTVQFMLANLVGLAPLLAAATLADLLGIPVLLGWLAFACLLVALVTLFSALRPPRSQSSSPAHSPAP